MAKYKAYPEYKDSGVEWLESLPIDWKGTRLKLETFINMGQSPSSDDCNIEGVGLPFLQGNAEFGKINPIAKQYCQVSKKIANAGELLFSVRAPVGAINFADKKYGIGRGLCSIAASIKTISSFLWWLLPTYKYQLDAVATGSTFEAVSAEQLGNLCFALPSLSEQVQIAAFLDHETAKIDNLIEKQQQLIELLKEKRQAVISHAVTKGLNSDVPMKDSGVEWLGEVPEHWDVVRLKYLISTFEQGWSPQCDARLAEENEFGVLKVGCVNSGKFNPLEHKALPLNLEPQRQYLLKKNDLLISRANTKELVGSSAVVDKNYDNLILCDKLYRINLRSSVSPCFISEYLRTPFIRKKIELSASGASHSMQNIGQDTIKELVVALPPENEVQLLIEFMQKEINTFNTLTDLSHRQIALLQERRTALISAAVTGKIDVRDWTAPAPQQQKAKLSEEALA